MKAIILAAGYATRLYPLTENFPKPLLMVGGKPILDWLISDLEGVIDEFIVVTNHKFAGEFEKWSADKENVVIVDDGTESNETRLGAVKDIQLAANGIYDVFVMAGDNVLDFSLVPFITYASEVGTSCVMAHTEERLEALRKTAVITVDEENRITSYEEKPRTPKGNLAVPPFYYYRVEDVKRIGEALEDGCGYDAPGSFAAWLSGKVEMHAWKMTGSRHDIGDMKSYRAIINKTTLTEQDREELHQIDFEIVRKCRNRFAFLIPGVVQHNMDFLASVFRCQKCQHLAYFRCCDICSVCYRMNFSGRIIDSPKNVVTLPSGEGPYKPANL